MNIIHQIAELENKHNIKLRPQQVNIIKYVLYQWLGKGQKNVFVEAPTGSGKSIIAFFISEIMNKLHKTGYILTSDVSLQNQYATDAKKLKFYRPDVKGVDNYTCSQNQKPYSQGTCKIKHLDYVRQRNLKCYDECPYIVARKAASDSDSCILNYNYYMIQHNTVRKTMSRNAPFQIREFTIYDEAHKLIDIVQDMYAPVLNKALLDHIETFEYELNKNDHILGDYVSFLPRFYDIFTKLRLCGDKRTTMMYFNKLLEDLDWYKTNIKEPIEQYIEDQFEFENMSVFEILYLTDYIKFLDDFHEKIIDYVDLINNTELDTMFINNQETFTKYNFINEHHLIKKNLLDNSNLNLFMSATLGEEFPQMLGCKDYVYKSLDSDFNFENSPIYVYKDYYVNYGNKDNLFPQMLKDLDLIISSKHPNERGLIHTSSYIVTKFIKENSTEAKRLLDYENSKEKELAIETLKISNLILMGPSLVEGIDLPDDISRFQIIFKIPYPSLADRFIKYKFDKNKEWYNWMSRIKIQQALGRSIRHKEDYAISYVLDSNIIKMMNKFPNYIKSRIKIL
jgi:Rad3-related DNA helicase